MNKHFEAYLSASFDRFKESTIKEAMCYAMDGGKRFRPEIIFAIVKGFGLAEELAYPSAAALEYIQTYSLIHDDLPAMDNDDFRRGKPSLHKAFREDIAILTGDALLTHSFEIIAACKEYDDQTKVLLIKDLAAYAGMDGMIYGQLLDVTAAAQDFNYNELLAIQDNKTAALFKYCALAASHIAKCEDEEYFKKLGQQLGLIFQNQDDLFDIIKSEKELGKTNSDVRNNKLTALRFFSVDELKEHIAGQFAQLDAYLAEAPFATQYLKEIIERMRNR